MRQEIAHKSLIAEFQIETSLPPDQVFAFLSDMENFPKWFPGVLELKAVTSDPIELGKQYREQVVLPLQGEQSIYLEVVELESPKRFVTEASWSPVFPRMEIDLVSTQGGTTINWRMYSRTGKRVVKWIVLPLLSVTLRRRARIASFQLSDRFLNNV